MNVHLGQYKPGNSYLHKMDPRVKMALSVFFMITIFFYTRWSSLLVYGAFLLALWISSGISFRDLFQSIRAIFFLAIFSFVLNAFAVEGTVLWAWGPLTLTREGLAMGAKLCLRLVFLVSTSSLLLTFTTSPLVISAAIEDLLSPLKRLSFPTHELALMISIALRFVPTLAQETETLLRAQASRGADYDNGKLLQRARGLLTILVPLFVSAVQRALDLATAMEARAYFGGEGRSRYLQFELHARDYALLVASFALSVVIMGLERGWY